MDTLVRVRDVSIIAQYMSIKMADYPTVNDELVCSPSFSKYLLVEDDEDNTLFLFAPYDINARSRRLTGDYEFILKPVSEHDRLGLMEVTTPLGWRDNALHIHFNAYACTPCGSLIIQANPRCLRFAVRPVVHANIHFCRPPRSAALTSHTVMRGGDAVRERFVLPCEGFSVYQGFDQNIEFQMRRQRGRQRARQGHERRLERLQVERGQTLQATTTLATPTPGPWIQALRLPDTRASPANDIVTEEVAQATTTLATPLWSVPDTRASSANDIVAYQDSQGNILFLSLKDQDRNEDDQEQSDISRIYVRMKRQQRFMTEWFNQHEYLLWPPRQRQRVESNGPEAV